MLQSLFRQLFVHPHPHALWLIAVKTATIYLFLVLGLRLLGKRELGQMNVSDLVLVIVLANAVQNAMVGDDTTLDGGLVAAVTLLVLNRLLAFYTLHSRRGERLLIGEPLLLYHDGTLFRDRMSREGVTREQVLAALREHGFVSLDQIRSCMLEVDGTLSVVPKDTPIYRTRHHFKALRTS